MPGERKAMRKRVVLSNTNAFEVPDLVDIDAQNILDEQSAGKVMGLPGPVVDQLRAIDAFKPTQGWSLFRRPAMLVREEGVQLAKSLIAVAEGKQSTRLILDGDRGTGKSMMAIQAQIAAFLNGWIVINIPDAKELTTATTEYAPVPDTNPTLYSQNAYAALLLAQIGKANQAVLSDLTISLKHEDSPVPLPENTSLARLVALGARDPDVAWPVFNILWREITTSGRPPVFVSVDSMNYFMQNSAYRSPDFELIHAHDLALVKIVVDLLSGTEKLPNGGAVIAAMNRSHGAKSLATELAITQQLERQSNLPLSQPDPFKKYDERILKALTGENIEVLKLKGISRDGARALMEYWAKSGLLRQKVDEKIVAEKWSLAGNGIVGELERGALRMRI